MPTTIYVTMTDIEVLGSLVLAIMAALWVIQKCINLVNRS